MTPREALEIVLELAIGNAIDPRGNVSDEEREEHARQFTAIEIVGEMICAQSNAADTDSR